MHEGEEAVHEGKNGEEEKIKRGRKLLEVSSWEEEKKEREEKEKKKGTGPESCSGLTRTDLEWNYATRGRCLPTSVLFYS